MQCTRQEVQGGTNVADIGLTSQLLVETVLDGNSCVLLTSSDIEAFFDHVPPGQMTLALSKRVDPYLAAAAARLHVRPQLYLEVMGKLLAY